MYSFLVELYANFVQVADNRDNHRYEFYCQLYSVIKAIMTSADHKNKYMVLRASNQWKSPIVEWQNTCTFIHLFLPGPWNDLRMVKQFPCKTLATTVAIVYVFPIQQTFASRANCISVTSGEHFHFCDRKRGPVGNSTKKGDLTLPLHEWIQRHNAIPHEMPRGHCKGTRRTAPM